MSDGDSIEPRATGTVESTGHGPTESSVTAATTSTRPTQTSTSELVDESQPNIDGEGEQVELLQKLESVVEKYRTGGFTKAQAISGILRTLEENTGVALSESQKDAALDSYLAEIASIHSHFTNSDSQQPTSSDVVPSAKQSLVRQSARLDGSDDEDDDEQSSKKRRLLESDMPWFTGDNQPSLTSIHPS